MIFQLCVHLFSNNVLVQIWNHPSILQLKKDDRAYGSCGDTTDTFLADNNSSDENIDYNTVVGGIL